MPRGLAEFDIRVPAAVVFLFSSGGLMVISLCVSDYLRDSWLPAYVAVGVLPTRIIHSPKHGRIGP